MPPLVVTLNEENGPRDLRFGSLDVEASRFSRPPGVSQNLGFQDHSFSFTSESFEVAGDSFSGFRIGHSIEGAQAASYGLVPAFGVVDFELDGTRYELCDFRICTSTGCEGRESCDNLSCDN